MVEGETRGYVLEVFDGHFELPGLGPIGKLEESLSQQLLLSCTLFKICFD